MSRGWRRLLYVVLLLALVANVAIVLSVNRFTQYALVKQAELPSASFYEKLLTNLSDDFRWHLHAIEPDDPVEPGLRRFPVRWSTAQTWADPEAPEDLVGAVNDNLNRLVAHIPSDNEYFFLNNWMHNPLLRDESGDGEWLFALRLYVIENDTVAVGVCTPMDALYDHYLPHWFNSYYQHAHTGRHLSLVAERFPLQLLIKPSHSSRDTLYLLEGAEELVMFDQVFPREDIEEYDIETNILGPGIGWLTIRGPGLMDQMLLTGAKRAYWWLYAAWIVLLVGLVWLMKRSERRRRLV